MRAAPGYAALPLASSRRGPSSATLGLRPSGACAPVRSASAAPVRSRHRAPNVCAVGIRFLRASFGRPCSLLPAAFPFRRSLLAKSRPACGRGGCSQVVYSLRVPQPPPCASQPLGLGSLAFLPAGASCARCAFGLRACWAACAAPAVLRRCRGVRGAFTGGRGTTSPIERQGSYERPKRPSLPLKRSPWFGGR